MSRIPLITKRELFFWIHTSNRFFVFFLLPAFLFAACSQTDYPIDEPVSPKDGTDFLSFQLKDENGNLYPPYLL